MNNTTEQNINEAIDWLQKTGGAIQDFAVEQMPLYCREVVAWQFWSGLALAIISAIGILFAVLFFISANREIKSHGEPFERFLAGIVISFLSLPVFLFGSAKWIKAAVAPRMVIVEHFQDMRR